MEQAQQPGRLGAGCSRLRVRGFLAALPPGQKSFDRTAQDRRPPFTRDFFPTGIFRIRQGDRNGHRRRAGSACPTPCQEAAAGPRNHQGDRRDHRRRAGSVCPLPYQEAAAGTRSCQGNRRCLPPPGRFCPPSPLPGGRSRPQELPGKPQVPPAAGAVTFNARRDYELLEQVVSTYGR